MGSLRRITLIAGLTVLLIVSGTVLLDAERKPKTPSYAWSMTVPMESFNVLGMVDHIYKDGVDKTRIYYSEDFDNPSQTMRTTFMLFIDASSDKDEWVAIQGASVRDAAPTGEGDPCGFPLGGDTEGGCMEAFLNSVHPDPGYNHIMFRLVVHEALENFQLGVEVPWTGGGGITIYFWNSFDCGDGVNIHYHSVSARVTSLNCVFPAGYYITRTGPDTWKFRIEKQDFELDEHYCVTEQVQEPVGNSGKYKTVTRTQTYHPQTAWTTLSYAFELTREKK